MLTRSKRAKLNKSDVDREIYGVQSMDTPYCFNSHKLKEIWAAPHIKTYGVPKHVIIGIDTNSGKFKTSSKSTSKFAMISGIEQPDSFCVTGIENLDANVPNDYTPQMIRHVRELQHRFPHSQLVVIVDGMLSMDGGIIQREFQRESINSVIFVSTGNEKPGVQIGADEKRDFMITMHDAISRNQISFHEEITTSHADLNKLKAEFLDQMCKFSQIKEVSDDPYKAISVYYSGKLTKGMFDDLCVTFQMIFFFKRFFYGAPKYKRFN